MNPWTASQAVPEGSQVARFQMDTRKCPRSLLRFAAIALTAATAAVASVACSSGPRRVTVPAPLVGKWFGQNSGDSIEFTDSGVFVVELRGVDPLIGRCVFKGTRITLRYQLGSTICPEEPGEYTFEVDGSSLKFIDAADTCQTRRDAFAQSWRRSEQG